MKTIDKPLANKGLKSYRYKGNHGYIMIGAKDVEEALTQANLSLSSGAATVDKLQVHKNGEYSFVDLEINQ